MQPLEWTIDDFVFVPQLDADHQKIFHDAEKVRQALSARTPASQVGFYVWRLSKSFAAHGAGEERLMRTSRYPALQWHEHQHQAGRAKLLRLTEALHGNNGLVPDQALEEFATWLRDHIRLADRMLAAHLRNDIRERMAS